MITVCIVYPTDPLGVIPGGTDTCIRDILRCAPADIRMRLIGVTTDAQARPPRRWTSCTLSGASFEFYPVIEVANLRRQMKIPLSLRFTVGLLASPAWRGADILQFHRLEPAALFRWNPLPKIAVIHQNMKVIEDKSSDIRWKYLPGAYFKLEDWLIPGFAEIRIVREDAVMEYRTRFPARKAHISFLPTWMNPDLFFVPDPDERQAIRREILEYCRWPADSLLMISVGRLDHQKDPLRALEVLHLLKSKYPTLRYIMLGDGVLRDEVEQRVQALGLRDSVAVRGAMLQEEVARILRGCDLMLLTSAYEGMPRCVVEALGCGLPVVSTDVGEVRLLIQPGRNGGIAGDRTKEAIAAALEECLGNLDSYWGAPCAGAVQKFSARVVLEDLYSCYRRIGQRPAGRR